MLKICGKGKESKMDGMIRDVTALFNSVKICKSHDINHALTVMKNSEKALKHIRISHREKLMVKTASLLHDVDDRKFFPDNKSYENAKNILQNNALFSEEEINCIVRMIDLVSASKNRNQDMINDVKEWMLIPRWCDRIEALGWIGIVRCWDYTLTSGKPLWTKETPRAISIYDLRTRVAPPERYFNYRGESKSMVDHYYDKLLHISVETGNPFIDHEMKERMRIMEDLCVTFGELGYVPKIIYTTALNKTEYRSIHRNGILSCLRLFYK